ncbi:alpha/beta-hydrolase [Microthyrium microscopicum]|uniref:Alpha/beta-hydrolase n=1 Tax=Microthyrium microscopicum TaxID=703497 RepID=A0A6A6U2J6_9PEZI|nr:alpha/beta-hydrolase [Microthyrium microscopicum]
MDEKALLQPEPHRTSWSTRISPLRKPWIAGICVTFAFLLWIQQHPLPSLHHGKPCHNRQIKYAGESIHWKFCGDLKGRPLECTNLTVPLDQFNSTNSANRTFSIPLIRLRGKNATENLLLNPGGPGGSGEDFLYRRGLQINTIVGEGFHLLSFDPRGVNGSRPLASCYPTQEARRQLSPVRESRVEDSAEVYAWAQNYGKACKDTTGEHGAYINTPQTAADMNSILDAVGQKDLVYWGFSYGTLLGQTYASLFPERSRRVIIDGVVNQFDWYENVFDAESLEDTDAVFGGFLDECIKAGKNCSLSALGKTKDELWHKILKRADELSEQPLSVYVNSTVYGSLDYEDIIYKAIFPSLYKPANWYDLADRLTKFLNGNATDLLVAHTMSDTWDFVGDSVSFVLINDGLSGPKYWPSSRKDMITKTTPWLNQSLFSMMSYGTYYRKQAWAIPKTHTFVPKKNVKTVHPLLILSTTYDPVCPLVSAHAANRAFEGSKIVELKSYGHCTVSMPSECVAKHVRKFLYNGTLPDSHTTCEVDGAYFVKPEEDGKLVAMKEFDDVEDQRLHLAQVEIARDRSWPYRY